MSALTFENLAREDVSARVWNARLQEVDDLCRTTKFCYDSLTLDVHLAKALQKATFIAIAKRDDQLVGFALCEVSPDTDYVYMSTLFALRAGAAILGELLSHFKRLGKKWLLLDSTMVACTFYLKMGLYFYRVSDPTYRRYQVDQAALIGPLKHFNESEDHSEEACNELAESIGDHPSWNAVHWTLAMVLPLNRTDASQSTKRRRSESSNLSNKRRE